jgi:tRNA threonylcarbamoyladenosine biosynthesis protein TsaB
MQNSSCTIVIDTTKIKEVTVHLKTDGAIYTAHEAQDKTQAQRVLPMITQLLAQHHKTIQDITAIDVATGPGSFTGLRVGFSIANALGYLLGVSVNGKPLGEAALPQYE